MKQPEAESMVSMIPPDAWRRRDALGLLSLSLAGTLGLPALAQSTGKQGGVLKIANPANPSSLDPATGGAGYDHPILWTIYDTLVEWDYPTLKPRPGLAEWHFTDAKTMLLTLKPGIKFHDGTPCDAEAVKWNIERNRSDPASNVKADMSNIVGVEVTGPLQVKLTLNQPDASLPAILSDRAGMMVSPSAYKAAAGQFNRKPVGAGPWKFVSWADNQKVVVARHAEYWRPGLPYLDGIEFVIITEPATAVRSVVTKQNDFVYQFPARYRPIVAREKTVKTATGPTVYCHQIFLNFVKAPLDNTKVRQALNFAINRDAIVRNTLDGAGEAAYMLMPSTHWAYDKSVAALYQYDPTKAKKLLSEAGFPSGLELSMGAFSDQDSLRRAEIIMDQFGKAGIRVKLTNGTVPEMVDQFFGKEKKFHALLSIWTGRPDPSMTYGQLFSKNSYYNTSRSDFSPELSNLLDESRAKEDISFRRGVFSKIQRTVMGNALVVPLAFQFELDAMSTAVQGFVPNMIGKPKFNNVWLQS